MYCFDIDKQTLTLEGITYTHAQLLEMTKQMTTGIAGGQASFRHELFRFLSEWFTPSPFITVHTSGSTGQPKPLVVRKEQMMRSAEMTCSYLNLQEGDKTLLCLPLTYIAGKMMVVRSLVAGLDLYPVTPSGHPLENTNVMFRFAAMIPLQVYNSLRQPTEKERLSRIANLIIGGSPADQALRREIARLPHPVFLTYGMTETLSHIALCRLNGTEPSHRYVPFANISLSLSNEGTLVINAPAVNDQTLVTNDVARLYPDGTFDILGRKDNTLISGGVKIQIEEVESLLAPLLSVPFAITSQSHPKFGEIVVLLTEGPVDLPLLEKAMKQVLTPYQLPKKVLSIPRLPLTSSGKINRMKAKELASANKLAP